MKHRRKTEWRAMALLAVLFLFYLAGFWLFRGASRPVYGTDDRVIPRHPWYNNVSLHRIYRPLFLLDEKTSGRKYIVQMPTGR